jgi:seryl-tRNA synthetase
MLDIKVVREDPTAVAAALKIKGYEFPIEHFLELDARRKQADIRAQSLLADRKLASKKIGELVGQGRSVDEAKSEVAEILEKISGDISIATEEARQAQEALSGMLLATPNTPDARVPPGATEEDNHEVLTWGEPKAFDFQPLDHVDIGELLGQIDATTAGKITGSRFTVMSGEIARLHRALVQFMLNEHIAVHGYTEVYVPYIVNRESLVGTGQLPKFEEDLFCLQGDQDYYLIPTAEVPVTNIARDRIRYVAHTPCFRSEAGSYGRDTRGLIRQHQFEKVELVHLVRPTQSDEALESLTAHAEHILQSLELPYRKVILCGGDLGFGAQLTYDLEVWLPGQDAYREISSCSNYGAYQARRMQARWRNPETGKPEPLHTINGSGLAVGRTLVAILENYQEASGDVLIPKVLRPYMQGLARISAGQ